MPIRTPFEQLFETDDQVDQAAREMKQDVEGPRQPEGDPPIYRCKVCAYTAPERAYCPKCLADTMVEVVPPSRGTRGSRRSARR